MGKQALVDTCAPSLPAFEPYKKWDFTAISEWPFHFRTLVQRVVIDENTTCDTGAAVAVHSKP